MRKIKILLCGISNTLGGIEIFLDTYSNKINKDLFEVDFVNIYDDFVNTELYKKYSSYGNVYNLPSYKRHPLKFIRKLKKLQLEKKYDIFHHNMSSLVFLTPLIAAKYAGIRNIIVHAHNDSSDKGILKSIIHNFNRNFVNFFGNEFFACSDNAAKWFFKGKIYREKKYYIVENAIDMNIYKFNEEKRNYIREKCNIRQNEKLYGHVGNFKAIKNHSFLIDIFYEILKKEPSSKLLLIGDGETITSIKEKVARLKIEDRVVFVGSKENVFDYLSAMDVFIFPSIHEGLGISYIEAQVSGLPCIISDTIPFSADISNCIFRESLNSSSETWAKLATSISVNKNRQVLYDNAYDINNAIKKLENIYSEIYKIKIAHFVYGIKNGGVEKVLTNYFGHMDLKNYDLFIVTQGESDMVNYQEFESIGFKIYTVTKKGESIFKNFKEIMEILKKEEFDIVHCHMSSTNFFPLFYSWLSGVKVRISHSHTAIVKKTFAEKVLCKLSNIFDTNKMACSKEAAEWLFGNSDKAVVLKNALDLDSFKYDLEIRQSKRKEFNIMDDIVVIGNVARFEKQKNHEFIIDVFKTICKEKNNYMLLLIGSGSKEEKIKKMVLEYGLSDKVIFLGSRSDVFELYQAMDIFFLPSLYEGLPVTGIEAQAVGLPCFVSDTITMELKITENVYYKSLNDSVQSWANCMTQIRHFKRKSQKSELIKNGYEIFSAAEKLSDYYYNILNK